MVTGNKLWNSPPREEQAEADKERREREADKSLIHAASKYDSGKIAGELKKYESNLSDLKAFAILLN